MPLRPRPPERFFFVHLQKTAGISLLWRLRRVFPDSAIYPNDSDGDMWQDQPQMSVDRLLARWAEPRRRGEIRLVAGHFPLATADLLEVPFQPFTVVREPVARTVSFLNHYGANHDEWRHRPVEELYDDPFVFRTIIRNHMTKMLGMDRAEMTAGVLTDLDLTNVHLRRAQDNLERMELVGVTESLERFTARLEARFGWDLGDPIRSNESPAAPVPEELRKRIAQDNPLDVELYEFARQHWL